MIGTDLEIQTPDRAEIAGADAVRLPTLRTTAETDLDLIEVWLKSHADGSAHTLRAYRRIGTAFVDRGRCLPWTPRLVDSICGARSAST